MDKKYKLNRKILILFVLINYIHLTPMSFKILIGINDFIDNLKMIPLSISFWVVGFVLLWVLFTIYLLIGFIKILRNNENFFHIKFLFFYLIASFLFLIPLYLLNIDEIFNSTTTRTLLMMGKIGLFQIYMSGLVFLSTALYLIMIFINKIRFRYSD